MDFKEEDFPLYQQLVKLDELGVEAAKTDFKKAVEGGDAEKLYFAIGIQTVVVNVPIGVIAGVTQEMNDKTMYSCMKIFQAAAAKGNETAAMMAQSFKERGLGKAPNPPPAPKR